MKRIKFYIIPVLLLLLCAGAFLTNGLMAKYYKTIPLGPIHVTMKSCFTVTYDANDGNDFSNGAQTNVVGYTSAGDEISGKYEEAKKTDFVFAGWYTDKNCTKGNEFDPETDTVGLTEDKTVYAKWVQYKVTYNTNGGNNFANGTANNTVTYTPEGKVASGSVIEPDRLNYGFKGWFKDTACTQPFDTEKDVVGLTKDITVYAGWLQYYKVTYDANGGTPTSTVYYKPDGSVSSGTYTEPTKAKAIFDAWYTDTTYKTKFNTTTGVVGLTKDITVYAKWIPLYTVTYNSQGGSNYTTNAVTYKITNGIGSVHSGTYKAPARSAYLFEGWYKDTAYTQSFNLTTDINSLSADITVYAKWIPLYTVTYNTNGGNNFSNGAQTNALVYKQGGTLYSGAYEAAEKTDYVFAGWYTDTAGTAGKEWDPTNGPKTLSGNITVYAKWIQYKVTYNTNGGNNFANGTANNIVTYTPEGKIASGAVIAPTRTNYGFTGWYKDAACTQAFNTATDVVGLTKDITVYAGWLQYYKVTYDANGGSPTSTVYYKPDGSVNSGTYTEPTKTKAIFDGWYTDTSYKTKFNMTTGVVGLTKDITAYAKWIPLYTVTYNANGGSPTSTVTYKPDGSVYSGTYTQPTKSAALFDGWYTDTSYGTAFNTTTGVVGLTKDITVYAKWIPLYTLTYNANGGTFSGGATTNAMVYKPAGVLYSGTYSVPTRSGYNFVGWYTSNSTFTSSTEFDPTTGTSNLSANKTVYARWININLSNVLLAGGTFYPIVNSTFSTATTVRVTDKIGPSTATDVSAAKDTGVVAWQEGSILYISSQRSGVYVQCNTSGQSTFRNVKASTIDLTNFRTDNASTIGWMFSGCTNLTSIDVSKFNTSKAYNSRNMFENCSKLTTLDISNFKLQGVTNAQFMFSGCTALKSIKFPTSSSYGTGKNVYFNYMFQNCKSLTTLDLRCFDTRKAGLMNDMFRNCSSLKSIMVDRNIFKVTSNCGYVYNMFLGCKALQISEDVSTDIQLSAFDLSGVDVKLVSGAVAYGLSGMFNGCAAMTKLDLSDWNTSSVNTSMIEMFKGMTSLTELNISNFDTSKVTSFQNMFMECPKLTTLDLSSFDMSSAVSVSSMFNGCTNLSKIITSQEWYGNPAVSITEAGNIFDGCTALHNQFPSYTDKGNYLRSRFIDNGGYFTKDAG